MEDKIFAIVTFARILLYEWIRILWTSVIEIVGRCTFDKIVGWWNLKWFVY